ncbi:Hint domain-containing protein [Paracoccus limosus]|nr:Hint domain-containing protein [Paracoccus limosus]
MPTVNISAIALGTHPDLDPDEQRLGAENARSLLGHSFGNADSPLARNMLDLTLNDRNNDGAISFNTAWGNPAGEYVRHDNAIHYLDTGVLYSGTVTYMDGSTASNVPLRVLQDVNGNLVLVPPPHTASRAEIDALTTRPLQSLQITGLLQNDFSRLDISRYDLQDAPAFVCFRHGTLIRTERGDIAVEHLRVGDRVMTRDNGPQVLRWIGRKALDGDQLRLFAQLRPVRIRAGALGRDMPRRDLHLSQQHRVLVGSRIAERIFGRNEVLVAAKHLLALPGIERDDSLQPLEYYHLLFDRHEILFSEGAQTESLFTGPEALRAIDAAARAEIVALFPELAAEDPDRLPARQIGKGHRARNLARRHADNRQPLQAGD